MKNSLLIIVFVLFSSICFVQKIIFHEYLKTASDIHIKKWNINKSNLPNQYVEETIDNKDRVTELKFYRNGSLKYSHLCYLSVWIKYEYPNDKTIVAYFLDSDGKENAEIECGMPSKTIYYLSQDKKEIVKTKSEFNLDKKLYVESGWTESELEDAIKTVESEKVNDKVVSYYAMSFFKLNKIYPVSNEFQIQYFQFSEKENEEIIKCLNKK